MITTPNGLEGIIETFGDINDYIDPTGVLDPGWNARYLSTAELPYPLTLAWDTTKTVTHITCHVKMADVFEQVFQQILGAGLQSAAAYFGGCFAFRPQRTGRKLSTHAWGIAIDIDPMTNEQRTPGDIDRGVVQIFKNAGFSWGGDWSPEVRDPMHMQFATGY